MKKLSPLILCFVFAICITVAAWAQSGGTFVIEKSVIGGGGQTTGGTFSLDGTIGQTIGGATSTGGTFELGSGFWGGGLAPVSSVSVSGRVTTPDGRGLRNATVSITGLNNAKRTVTTSSFGFYSFDNVLTGDTYTIAVRSKLYRFSSQIFQIDGNLTGVDFVGVE